MNPKNLSAKLLRYPYYRIYATIGLMLSSRLNIGKNIFEYEWDLLIVLDACRVDALETVADEYKFLDKPINSIVSVGSSSSEWICNTFVSKYKEEINDTVLITANPHTQHIFVDGGAPNESTLASGRFAKWDVVNDEEFKEIIELWKYNNGDFEHPEARPLTDITIKTHRLDDPERILTHYMQPHAPYIGSAINEGRKLYEYEKDFAKYLVEDGGRDQVWTSYLDNLRYVLDDIELLLKNIDAKRIYLTADHGEAFGDWGVYGHPLASPHPKVRKVPFVELSAEDTKSYDPSYEIPDAEDITKDEQLEALGYK